MKAVLYYAQVNQHLVNMKKVIINNIEYVPKLAQPIQTIGISKTMAYLGIRSRKTMSDLISSGTLKLAKQCKRKTLLLESVEKYKLLILK